ncbi:MAG: 1,2-phenylacetyl-CoA epoxidase subunit PaaC [Pseudomonadota bacterium]
MAPPAPVTPTRASPTPASASPATLTLGALTPHVAYVLRLADDQLILGHRLSEWTGHAPMLEEDIALANLALDHIGAARTLYDRASALHAEATGDLLTEDDFAYRRDTRGFLNVLLVERPNGDFAHTMVRQLLYSAFALEHWRALMGSADATLAAIAAKSEKEARYHVRHSGDWFVRLADGTDESRTRTIAALDGLWPYTGELFEVDDVIAPLIGTGIAADPLALKASWSITMEAAFAAGGLEPPSTKHMQTGGRAGRHTEHLTAILDVMQSVARAHPGAVW